MVGYGLGKFIEFAENHKDPGVFTDNDGIVMLTTIDLLRVNLNVVSASNNDKNPVTKFKGPVGSEHEFFLGYHQDTTDIVSDNAIAGHYESLTKVQSDDSFV